MLGQAVSSDTEMCTVSEMRVAPESQASRQAVGSIRVAICGIDDESFRCFGPVSYIMQPSIMDSSHGCPIGHRCRSICRAQARNRCAPPSEHSLYVHQFFALSLLLLLMLLLLVSRLICLSAGAPLSNCAVLNKESQLWFTTSKKSGSLSIVASIQTAFRLLYMCVFA